MYFTKCPRFQKCAVNSCPLDPEQDEHKSMAIDPEKECKLDRKTRMEIAKDTDLPKGGLTKAEFGAKIGAMKRWKNPSVEQQRLINRRMEKVRKTYKKKR